MHGVLHDTRCIALGDPTTSVNIQTHRFDSLPLSWHVPVLSMLHQCRGEHCTELVIHLMKYGKNCDYATDFDRYHRSRRCPCSVPLERHGHCMLQ